LSRVNSKSDAHTTQTGRVVYARKTHFFRDSDLIRIFRARVSDLRYGDLASFRLWIMDIFRLEVEILIAAAEDVFKASKYGFILSLVRIDVEVLYRLAAGYVDSALDLLFAAFKELSELLEIEEPSIKE
jgi:hypothetical protein